MNIRKAVSIIATIGFLAFQMYIALVKQFPPMVQGPTHLVFALLLVFLYFPADRGYTKKLKKQAEDQGIIHDPALLKKWEWLNWIDLLFYAGLAYLTWYLFSQSARLTDFIVSISDVYVIDYIAMVVAIVLLLVAVYRTLGLTLTVFIAIFIIYAWMSPYLPGILFTKPKSTILKFLDQFTAGMVMTERGIFGTPLYTSASTLFYFMLFGAFFAEMGGGQLLIDIGMKASNKSSGGPAKAAVISSGLMGMISGSAVANVATTGVLTIPMMKKVGYTPEEAGAVEAVASTGGQIMPPIMGVGAFIMAELLGVNYMSVAVSAIIPALAYYFAVFILVDRLAAKRAAKLDRSIDAAIAVERKILPRLYLLIPAVLLVVWIVRGVSLMRAGMIGIFACIGCNFVSYVVGGRKDFIGIKALWECCMDGTRQAASIAIPTAACGIIINVVTGQTSLAANLSNLITAMGTEHIFVALIITMIGCMLLGMALPTVAAYLVGTILFVPCIRPILISSGVEAATANLCANMFVFYYGIIAQITPPVCLASYTAAGIAEGNAMKTGWLGFYFALVGFLVPFVFVYNPAILLKGTTAEIVIGTVQLAFGTYFLATTIAGYFKTDMSLVERGILLVCAICLIIPEVISSGIGLILGSVVLVLNSIRGKRNRVQEGLSV